MTQPRLIVPGATYLLTRRTIRRYDLFAPDPQSREIFVYCLAIAAQRTGVLVHVITLMSTPRTSSSRMSRDGCWSFSTT